MTPVRYHGIPIQYIPPIVATQWKKELNKVDSRATTAFAQSAIERRIRLALSLTLAMLLIVSAVRAGLTNIHWDEFHYLSQIYAGQSGNVLQPLVTFHLRLFGWLTRLPGTEADQIQIARYVIFAMQLGTVWLLFKITRYVAGTSATLYALVLFVGSAEMLRHGTDFRPDPINAFFFVLTCWSLLQRRFMADMMAAAAMAVNVMVSIKVVFYAPTLMLIVFASTPPSALLKRFVRLGIGGALFLVLLASYHIHSLAHNYSTGVAAGVDTISHSATKVFGEFFPRWRYFVISLTRSPILWLSILWGLSLAIFSNSRVLSGSQRSLALAMILPIAALLIYRNAFSYFYVFLLPATVPCMALGYEYLFQRFRERDSGAAFLAIITLPMTAVLMTLAVQIPQIQDHQTGQREHINLVHKMFPQPVPYIDRNGMISSFPRVAPMFMSTWGMEDYRSGEPMFKKILITKQPPLLIANTPTLDLRNPQGFNPDHVRLPLLEPDFLLLTDNFVHHWGAIFVAGKHFNGLDTGAKIDFRLLIGGTYTIESTAQISINGKLLEPLDIIDLESGIHELRNEWGRKQDVVLRWGDNLPAPQQAEPTQPIYMNFP